MANGYQLARRGTGGGTVYHDLGVPLFSLVSPATAFSKVVLPTAVLSAACDAKTLCDGELPSLDRVTNSTIGSRFAVSPIRGDGWVLTDEPAAQKIDAMSIADAVKAAPYPNITPDLTPMRARKLIGSAFSIRRAAALHHVSVLADADGARLAAAITPRSTESRQTSASPPRTSTSVPPAPIHDALSAVQHVGVASVRSPVTNLASICHSLSQTATPSAPLTPTTPLTSSGDPHSLPFATAALSHALLRWGSSLVRIARGGTAVDPSSPPPTTTTTSGGAPAGTVSGAAEGPKGPTAAALLRGGAAGVAEVEGPAEVAAAATAADAELANLICALSGGHAELASMAGPCDAVPRILVRDPLRCMQAILDATALPSWSSNTQGAVLKDAVVATLAATARGAPGSVPSDFRAAAERLATQQFVLGGGPNFTVGDAAVPRYDLGAAAAAGALVPERDEWIRAQRLGPVF